jgi:hypothetical protein
MEYIIESLIPAALFVAIALFMFLECSGEHTDA